ncbi:TIR domain-containing protein [Nocardia sp. NPDC051787]|uniref:nSTAND1 domain-containing NTPase n=1 Tax=Nocardia sp. NPDC051787 TaxID=3155415 RepID=UPI003425C051
MSRIFISHSSRDNAAALALRQWLIEQDHELADEIFLDIHPRSGLPAGQRWKGSLVAFTARCEAVVCLVSRHWLTSRECPTEYRTAENLGKRIFVAQLEPVHDDVTREWQRSELHGPGAVTSVHVEANAEPVTFRTAGLHHLRDGLREAGITAARFPWPPPHDPDRAPYRGWDPFEAVDAAVYFGREQQILRGLDRLRQLRAYSRSLFVVLGPSGAGKSSFLRAGLIPRLARADREFVLLDILRPERRAITGDHGLAAALHVARKRLGLTTPTLGQIKSALTAGDSDSLRRWLSEIHSTARTHLPNDADPTVVLPIDQAEELFTADAGPEGQAMLALLSPILAAGAEDRVPLVVIAAIRTDRYEQMQSAVQLAEVGTELFDELKPLGRDRFREIITAPARRARAAGRPLDIHPEVIEQLLTDCRGGADTLPLLALTLSILYRDYGSSIGKITLDDYREIGGIEKVVTAEIDHILDRDPDKRENQLDLLRSAFVPWLATFSADTDEPLRRIARYDDLPASARPLIDRFVDRRLLVKDRRGADTTVEVALESLLRQWGELTGWLREQADTLRAADALEQSAADWRRHEHAEAWLLTGTRLADAENLAELPGYRERLRSSSDLLTASRRHENTRAATELAVARNHADALRRRARALSALTVVALIAAVLAAAGFVREARASERADTRAREAIAARLIEGASQMRAGARTEGDIRALHQILAAHALSPGTTQRDLLNAQYELRDLTRTQQLPATPSTVDASDDGSTIAAAVSDSAVYVTRNGQPDRSLEAARGVTDLAVSADASTVVVGNDLTGTLFIARAGQPVRTRQVGADLWGLRVSADGSTVVVMHNGSLLIARDGMPDVTSFIIGNFLDIAISADGTTVVAGDDDANLHIFRAGQPKLLHPDGGRRVAISADGTTIAAGKVSGDVVVTRAGGPTRILHSTAPISDLVLDANGTTVAATDDSGNLLVSRIGEPDRTRSLSGAVRLGISADGTTIAAGDDRGTLLIHRTGTPDQFLHLPDKIGLVRVATDASSVTAAAANGVLFSVRTATPRRTLLPPYTRTDAPAVSADGSTIVRRGGRGIVMVAQKDAPERVLHLSDSWPTAPAISADGSTIVIGDGNSADLHILRHNTSDYVLPLPGPVPSTGYWRVTGVAISDDGSTIAATAADPPTLFVYYRTGADHKSFPLPSAATALTANSDGSTIAAVDDKGRLHIARNGEVQHTATFRPELMSSTLRWEDAKLTVNPDGHTIVAADRGTVIVARTGLPARTLSFKHVSALAISADGSTVAIAGEGDITVIGTEDGRVSKTLSMPGSNYTLGISADGSTIAASDDTGSLVIAHRGSIDRTIRLPQPVRSLHVSADGAAVAAAGASGTVWYWRRPDPVPVVIATEDSHVRTIALDKDHNQFVLVTVDTVNRVPVLSPDTRALCAKLPAPITDNEWRQWISQDYPRQSEC